MRYLQQLPVDGVKIDRAILSNVNNKVNQEIIKITIDLAKTFNLEVIAEGVESSSALKYLRNLNCHFYQGYSFSRPVKHESFISLFQKNNKTYKRSKKHKESKRKKKNYTDS
jgi:EAL domain-containing protein (putative c-di-GMP-specific phosphodiesterase class I)